MELMMRYKWLFLLLLLAVLPLRAQNVSANYQYLYISTATTTAVRDGAGYLSGLTINGGTGGTVTLYDIAASGCSGTPGSGKFATIEAIGATNPVSLTYNLHVLKGICVVTAAATDLTITFN